MVKLQSNAARNEKFFLRNHKMLAIDLHAMDRKLSIGNWQRKSKCKSSGVQHAIPFSWFCEDMWFSLMI